MSRILNYIQLIFSLILVCYQNQAHAQCTAIIGSNTSPIKGCEVLTVQFNDLSTGAVQNRTWNFGDGTPTSGAQNPVHSYNAGVTGDTTYIVQLNIQCVSGPPSIARDTVRVYKKPKILFSSYDTVVCALTDSVCFINASSYGAGYSVLWNFGDFTTSNQVQPCHIYTTGGYYSPQLTVTNSNGCANSVTLNNYLHIIPSPNPDFTLQSFSGCAPFIANYNNTTDTITTSFSAWQWDFGDGSSPYNGYNPGTHLYTSPGTYFVSLYAKNSLGCSNRTKKAVVVKTKPNSSLTATSPICLNSTSVATFTGNNGPNATYNWNFSGGNGSPGSGNGPQTVSWTATGTYNVSLSVLDSGCTSSSSFPVIVNPTPTFTASLSPNDTICQKQKVTVTVSPASYSIYDFYVNNVLVQSSASNKYTDSTLNSGDSITVSVTDLNGCTSNNFSTPLHFFVKPLPATSLSIDKSSVCLGDTFHFTASPANFDSYMFFNGFQLLKSSASNLYSASNMGNGNSIYVTAIHNGCKGLPSNAISPITQKPLPPPQVNCGTTNHDSIQFVWTNIPGSTGYQISINGGPFVTPSSGSNGLLNWVTGLNADDTVTATVLAIGNPPCGNSIASTTQTCYARNCQAVTLSLNPYVTACQGDTINLDITGINVANPAIWWNGNPPSSDSTLRLVATQDTIISVSVSDPSQSSCVATKNFFSISVISTPVVTLSANVSNDSICQGASFELIATPGNYTGYTFYNDTSIVQNTNNPSLSVPSAVQGNYNMSVVANNQGCTYRSTTPINIIAVASPSVSHIITKGKDSVCTGDTVIITANPAGYTRYDFYDGSNLIQSSASNSYSSSSFTPNINHNIEVIATDYLGCSGSDSSPLSFFTLGRTAVSLVSQPTAGGVCSNDTIILSAIPTGLSAYTFYNNSSLIQSGSSGQCTVTSYSNPNSFSVMAIDQFGCITENSTSINFNTLPTPDPILSATASGICRGTNATLNASVPGNFPGATYLWSTGSTSKSTTVSPANSQMYYFKAIYNGCSSTTDSILISVDTIMPIANAGADQSICKGKSVQLNGSGGTQFVWSPSLGLNDASIATPLATPDVTTSYQLMVKNIYCESIDTVEILVDRCLTELSGPIPQIITPNEDGSNDVWIVPGADYFRNNRLIIYNRWGNVVYEANPYENTWNGVNKNGEKLPDAMYYYVLDLNNGIPSYSGFIVIHR